MASVIQTPTCRSLVLLIRAEVESSTTLGHSAAFGSRCHSPCGRTSSDRRASRISSYTPEYWILSPAGFSPGIGSSNAATSTTDGGDAGADGFGAAAVASGASEDI